MRTVGTNFPTPMMLFQSMKRKAWNTPNASYSDHSSTKDFAYKLRKTEAYGASQVVLMWDWHICWQPSSHNSSSYNMFPQTFADKNPKCSWISLLISTWTLTKTEKTLTPIVEILEWCRGLLVGFLLLSSNY